MNIHSAPESLAQDVGTVRIGILETGQNAQEFVDRHGTYRDWFTRWLGGAGQGRYRFSTYRACDGELPERISTCNAYVVTGSAASVTEQADWMRQAQGFLREAAEDRPVIGICFGHQLLADAYGGTVEHSERGWGVGVHTFAVQRKRPWMSPASDRISVVASHMDQVVAPPPGAEVLAGSDFCPIGMLQIGDNVLTYQNHPEITKSFAHALYSARTERLGKPLQAEALASLSRGTNSNLVGRWIANFIAERGAAHSSRP